MVGTAGRIGEIKMSKQLEKTNIRPFLNILSFDSGDSYSSLVDMGLI